MRSRARLLGAVALAAALLASACVDDPTVRSSEAASSTLPPPSTAAPAPTDAPITTAPDTTTSQPRQAWTLLAGGDVRMERAESLGLDPFAQVVPSLGSAEFSLVNVETAISDRGVPRDKEYVFRAPPSAAARLAAGGVRVANLANNHASDYGPDALTDTVDLLEDAGVTTVGAGRNLDEAYQYRMLATDRGVKVAFVGASLIVPWGFAATATAPGIASAHIPARARLLDTVRAAASAADAVVVAVHWGIERNPCPNDDQRLLAQQLFDAGADAVIGHHPHVLQPVVVSGGKLVAFSLGNFVWDPRPGLTGETGVLQVDFDGDEVAGWTFHPHLLDEAGAPVPADSGDRVERIRDIVSGNCSPYAPPPTTASTSSTTSLPPPDGTAGF